jgi:hypothetical protein
MSAREIAPPYVLLFQEATPGADPLVFLIDDRPSLPLFGSANKAGVFLESADFGPGWKPVEVSGAGLLAVLEGCRGRAEYVALDPPPAGESGMRVEMGGLEELIETLQTSQQETDLFGRGANGSG